jgi:hypothetical protein
MTPREKLHEVAFKLWKEHGWSFSMIGKLMGADHTKVHYWIRRHQVWVEEEKARRAELFHENCKYD